MELPPDRQLGPVALTDPGAAAAVLVPSLAPGTDPPRLRLRYLEHDVGTSLLVWYRAELGPDGADVVVSQGRLTWAQGRPPIPPSRAAALHAAGITHPATDGEGGGTTVAWYPFDPGLPALAADPAGFVPTAAGPLPEGPWRRLAWVPQQRAVLAAGNVVVKMEADPARLRAGVHHLELLRPVVRTPGVLAVHEPSGVYVQELLAGRPLGPPDALAWAPTAGALVARLAAAAEGARGDDRWAAVPRVGPSDLLAATRPVQRLVAHAAPDLASRIEQVAGALGASAPSPGAAPVHLAHGDFNAGQLLALPQGGLGLVDTDTLCLAPAGLDLATYAANLLAGRPDDRAAADAALAGLRQGYGEPADQLPWLVAVAALRRLDRPIRRHKSTWRRRVERHLADVEALAARC